MNNSLDTLAEQVRAGNRRAVARAITLVENGGPTAQEILTRLYAHAGRATIIGVTGAPGTGKSTLVTAIAKAYRQQNCTVAIVAVDPTSPFTGGALLGDRVRMRDLSGDSGIFIRSMATRGNLGGLARTTNDVVLVLDAAGFDRILIETVGVGQAEVDIASAAHTTLVVEAPGLGDEVQAIKAGVLEIADVLVVNKADRDGVNRTVSALEMMLGLATENTRTMAHHGQLVTIASQHQQETWQPPVIKTVAAREEGIAKVIEAIENHSAFLAKAGLRRLREQVRAAAELETIVHQRLLENFAKTMSNTQVESLVERIAARQIDPYTAANRLLEKAENLS